MSDANCIIDEGGNIIKGDKCIWYLCTNEKSGYLFLKNSNRAYQVEWGMGESSYKTVKKFIEILQQEGMIDPRQYAILMNEITIAKTLGDMYEIGNYLKTKADGKKWIPKITPTKKKIRQTFSSVKENLEVKGFIVKETKDYDRANDTNIPNV